MSNICGIDPGLKGAVAVLTRDGRLVRADHLPVKGKLVDAHMLAAYLIIHDVDLSVIENVFTRPGQGVASSGTFMTAKGTVYGVAATLGQVIWVTPQSWKRSHNLIGADKEASRQLARDIFGPYDFRLKKDVDKAEAALIALWYLRRGDGVVHKKVRLPDRLVVPKRQLEVLPPSNVQGQPLVDRRSLPGVRGAAVLH